jgi:uncharacterized membrane protein YfhO
MQVVQTRILRVLPLTLTRTLWRFGSQRRRVRLWAWLMLLPLIGLFSQITQTFDIGSHFPGMIQSKWTINIQKSFICANTRPAVI